MKVYITKGVLTHGIRTAEVESFGNGVTGMHKHGYGIYYHVGEWHADAEAALAAAEEARIKKLKSLDKQMKKLSALVFSVPEAAE